jgi:alpha-2-macroglobulin
MDIRKYLLLPLRLLQGLLIALGEVLRPLFGSVSIAWKRPAWIGTALARYRAHVAQPVAAFVRKHPRPVAIGGGVLAALLVVGVVAYQWYLSLPRPAEPERLAVMVSAPLPTDYAKADGTPGLTIHPVDIIFSSSAAPIEQVGKRVASGVVIRPVVDRWYGESELDPLKGEWIWVDDKTLRFTPAADWPIGAHLKVTIDAKTVVAEHVLLADDVLGFDIPPFTVAAGSSEFYQDPEIPTAKKTIMQVAFSHPVDPASFEQRISLKLKGRGDTPTALKFTVTYDAVKMKAWIHSQPLDLPRDDDAVVLTLEKGVVSSRGGNATPNALVMETEVPGLYGLKVGEVTPTLVNNDKFEPEQVLVMNFNGAVRGSDLANLVKVWVLPKRKAGVKQRPNDPPYGWDAQEVSDDVLRASQAVKLDLVATEKEYEEAQSFKFHALPGERLYVRILPGLKSFGGYMLGKSDVRVLRVPDYPKLLRFTSEGSLLALSGDRRVSVVSRSVDGIKLEIGRVLPDQLHHLVSQSNGTFAKPEFYGRFGETNIVERFEQTRAIAGANTGAAHYEGFDLSDYLKAGKHGVFILHLSAIDPKTGKAMASEDYDYDGDYGSRGSETSDTRLIVVTDLGMVVKRALDGSQDVFVQSIRTGQPVGGATVSVVAVNGQTLFTDTSSASGEAHFPSLKGLEREKRPVLYVVRHGDDLSFLPVGAYDRRLDYSRFDIGGEANASSSGQLSAYLFSDRGIYRPGDTIHIGVIVRTANWAQSPAGVPLQAEIVDPRGSVVRRQPVTVDASGFAELDYAPAETAPTGSWTVNLHIVGKNRDDNAIGSTTVSVKEFLPDSMNVHAGLSNHIVDGWVGPGALKGLVDARNLFGTAAAGRRVEASLTLDPTFPAFRGWPDYQFFDRRHAKDGYVTNLQDGKTDDNGHAEFDLDLKKYADATYRLSFLAKVYEPEGGRNVAATVQTMVSSNPWLVGYRASDDLSYVHRGAKRSIRLVAIDPQTRSIALGGLRAVTIERKYVSVLTKQDSGVYKYESKMKEVPVSDTPLAIAAGGMDYALATDKPGDFALVIKSGDVAVNRVEWSVTGEANLTRSLERNAELSVKLNKDDYVPGEPIEISLRAPYAGSGLITIERDKVYAHVWFTAKTTNSVQHITVPAGFEGNGYINVQYIRDPAANEIFMSPLSYGVAPFSVNVDARRNKLTIDAPEMVKPGQTVTFRLNANRPTKAVLFAVDEGILQVARYKLSDPLKFYFRKRQLDVQTSQILDLILPDFKKIMMMAAAGGDGGDAVSRQLNPFKRRHDAPVVYWSGIVDVNGRRDFRYTVPDYFHGKLRVMAVAVSPQLIGTAEGATTVRGDFVLSPDAPTTLAPGDEAVVGVGVSNNLQGVAKPVPVAVTLQTGPQLQVIGAATQSLTLAPMHEGVVTFRVRATDALGSGMLNFTARYQGKSASQRVDVSVRPAAAFRTQLTFARVAPGKTLMAGGLRRLYEPYSVRRASISTVPLVFSDGLKNWLENYDNYCSEQIVSASMPRLIAGKWSVAPTFARSAKTVSDEGANRDALNRQITALRGRQNEQGGFGLWTATPDAVPFVSAYAMHFLLEARDRGAPVPKDMIASGNRYLQLLAADDSQTDLEQMRQRAYAIYLLTRQGIVTTTYIAGAQKRMQDAFPKQWHDDLAAAWLAASYKLLKQDGEANKLIEPLQKQLERSNDNGWYFYRYYYDPLTRDASVLYILARHFPDRARKLSPAVMENIARPLQKNQFNTLSAAMTMLALDVYAHANAGEVNKLGIEELRFDGSSHAIAQLQNAMMQQGSWSGAAKAVRFADNSAVPAWTVLTEAGYDRDVPARPIKNGLEIIREYTDDKGKPLTAIKVGQEIDVHVKIRALGNRGIGDVAIVDLLPGGFEAVMQQGGEGPTLRLHGSSFTPDYTDVREDRVVLYGTAFPDVQEYVYRIRATAAGRFIVPPAYGEQMYDRRIQARSAGGQHLTVTRVP